MVRILLAILCFSSISSIGFAQKVKYKELFVLLNAKQYEQAEPFLRRYLAENDDNPNAYLFMGMIFQEKAAGNDVLKHTDILISNLDSAVIFYDKSYKQLDEKEIKRNDEYYQAYNRRDLRTGKFGVKLSDVQFDLEKRMEALRERKRLVAELRTHYDKAESKYVRSQQRFTEVKNKYGNAKTMFLRSNEETISSLKLIASVFDSSVQAFKQYKAVSEKIGNTGHNQELILNEIKNMDSDGMTKADFMQDKLEVWDYKRWAEGAMEGIEKEIVPMRDHLISYDIELNKLREKLKKDSVSVRSDLTKLVDKMLTVQLRKYDPNPMPMDVFGMKIEELEYLSELITNKPLRDSADVKLHVRLTESELKEVSHLDSVATKLSARNFDEDAVDYDHFVRNAYGTSSVLKSLVKTTKDFADREKKRKAEELQRLKGAINWMVTPKDSIPLFMEVPVGSKFKPLILVEEKYTFGFQFADTTALGYFSAINPARKDGLSVTFPVDNKVFTQRKLPVTKALSASDEKGEVFYALFYSTEKVNEKFPVTLAKIYRKDGLAWSSNFACELLPNGLTFHVESGEVAVKTTNAAGESKMVFVDRNGKKKEAPK